MENYFPSCGSLYYNYEKGLPEVDIECYGDAEDNNCVEYIPLVPAGTGGGNLLGCRGTKDKALNLFLVGSLGNQ